MALELSAPMPAGVDVADPRSVAVLLKALPSILRGGKPALRGPVDFDLARAVADVARLRAPSRPARWLAPEPDTIGVRRARARDRWLRAHPRPLVKPLGGIRIYDLSKRSGRLTWWDLADVVSIALRKEGILTPGYTELYVHLHDDVAKARDGMTSADWSEGAVAALPRRRSRPSLADLLDASEVAVLTRARIDHLDQRAIKRAFAKLRGSRKFEATLLHAVNRSRTHEARVVLAPVGNGFALDARVDITDVRSGKVSSHALPRVETWGGSHYLFHTLVFRKDAVELRARGGERANAARGDQPRVHRFPL